jgi:hypothetical protein
MGGGSPFRPHEETHHTPVRNNADLLLGVREDHQILCAVNDGKCSLSMTSGRDTHNGAARKRLIHHRQEGHIFPLGIRGSYGEG